MREKNRKPIASIKKLSQFTTMNVIDGQAGLVNYSSLFFYSLTIDNILNIIVLLILSGITIATLMGENGILTRANDAKTKTEDAEKDEKEKLGDMEDVINEYTTGIEVEQVTDENPGVLEIDDNNATTYIINSIEDLVFFANNVTGGNTYEGKTVKLGLSLDFKSNKSYVDPFRTDYAKYGYDGELKTLLTSGEGFIPIGISNNVEQTKYSFNGIFDGNGCVINNLYINKLIEDHVNDVRIGFFGNNYGTIQDLGVTNCNIYAKLDTNGNNTVIVGGIAGYSYGQIINCYSSGTISAEGANNAKTRGGGIVGTLNGYIYNCYNKSIISSKGYIATYIGGIAGVVNVGSEIRDCYNIGKITVEGLGKLSSNNGVGAAGIVGYLNENASVNNCYNSNEIQLTGTARYVRGGGIVGYSAGSTIDSTYNTGLITLTDLTQKHQIGGIAGTNYLDGIVSNSYYLSDTANKGVGVNTYTENDYTVKVENEKDMPNVLDIVGSAFKEDTNKINNGYPILIWQ